MLRIIRFGREGEEEKWRVGKEERLISKDEEREKRVRKSRDRQPYISTSISFDILNADYIFIDDYRRSFSSICLSSTIRVQQYTIELDLEISTEHTRDGTLRIRARIYKTGNREGIFSLVKVFTEPLLLGVARRLEAHVVVPYLKKPPQENLSLIHI